MSIGTLIAADLVPANRKAGAISIVLAGLSISTATGVPLGTFFGLQLGCRTAFMFIVVIGIIALVAV
ncbi:putative MFS family arabinose efflux permease [Gracilibacillus alcaliphilus]|nr:putative MFS family arabinose efflux permease [Gracilibacillus alcaliphilus]